MLEMPGPGKYNDEGVSKGFGKAGPKYTFNGKMSRKDYTVSPGPGAYDNSENAS